MTVYRLNPPPEAVAANRPPSRVRPILIAVLSVGIHAAIFGAAFAWRAPVPAPARFATVQVLSGQVDPWTGDFHASGVQTARIRQ